MAEFIRDFRAEADRPDLPPAHDSGGQFVWLPEALERAREALRAPRTSGCSGSSVKEKQPTCSRRPAASRRSEAERRLPTIPSYPLIALPATIRIDFSRAT